jgi:hypothetical protein
MPRDAARAFLAAQQRAMLYPERHVIEGTVVTLFAHDIPVDIDTGAEHDLLRRTLSGLIGRHVRVTIEVLPEGSDR